MKLLPSRELQEKKKANALDESIRITEVRTELSREERYLELFKSSTEAERKQIRDDFDGKLLEWNNELTKIEIQVRKLRKEREELLKPLDDTPEKIRENLASTDELIQYLTKRKKEVNQVKKEAENLNAVALKKVNELLEREHHLGKREIEISERDEKLKGLEELTALNAVTVNTELNKKNIELMLFEDKLGRKEVELAEREKLVVKDKEQIIKDRIRIESQQQSLIAAYAEARKNNLI